MNNFASASEYSFLSDFSIIDAHTHAWRPWELMAIGSLASYLDVDLEENSPYNWTPRFKGNLESLMAEEARAGVARFVLLPVASRPDKARELTEWAAAQAARNPEVIPFGAVHPYSDSLEDDVECIVSLGIKGVKLHSLSQGFDPLSAQAWKTYELLDKFGLIVLMDSMDMGKALELKPNLKAFKDSVDELRLENGPSKIAEAARAYPNLKIIAAHLGCCYGWDGLGPIMDLDNVYFDLAVVHRLMSPEQAASIIRDKGADKIIFGTDAPYRRPANALDWTLSLGLPEQDLRLILGDNLRRLFSGN